MKTRWGVLAAMAFAISLATGCGGGDDGNNPFEGRWIEENGASIEFGGSTWSDSQGDSGKYDYTELAVPEEERKECVMTFTLTLTGEGPARNGRACFLDEDTFRLCDLLASGAVGDCTQLARDNPVVTMP